jgi:hypothetical protein
MAVLKAKTLGKEQLILLPVDQHDFELPTGNPSVPFTLHTGRHAIVVSGYASVFLFNNSGPGFYLNVNVDDDDVFSDEVQFLVGPTWIDIVQVSASVSFGGILSDDTDEVDHSRWVIDGCTWEVSPLSTSTSSNPREKILLKVKLQTQGAGNGWHNLAYQVVATGTLDGLPKKNEISADI